MSRLAFIAIFLSAAVFCAPARAANRERDAQERAALLTAGKAGAQTDLVSQFWGAPLVFDPA